MSNSVFDGENHRSSSSGARLKNGEINSEQQLARRTRVVPVIFCGREIPVLTVYDTLLGLNEFDGDELLTAITDVMESGLILTESLPDVDSAVANTALNIAAKRDADELRYVVMTSQEEIGRNSIDVPGLVDGKRHELMGRVHVFQRGDPGDIRVEPVFDVYISADGGKIGIKITYAQVKDQGNAK